MCHLATSWSGLSYVFQVQHGTAVPFWGGPNEMRKVILGGLFGRCNLMMSYEIRGSANSVDLLEMILYYNPFEENLYLATSETNSVEGSKFGHWDRPLPPGNGA